MRSVKRLIAVILVLALLAVGFAGCASKGKTLMKLDGSEMSVNLFWLYLSRMKGMLCTTAYFGNSAAGSEFWDTWMDADTWTTYNDHYTKVVLEASKTYLAAVALFEERGLKLPDSYIEEIDAEMEELVLKEAEGSKTAFNAIIREYGVNYEMLREAYIVEAKIDYLEESLFGVNGKKIGANLIEEYYLENYARFKQIFLYSYEYIYEVDDNGDIVYYRDATHISYDTEKTAKKNADGSYATDANGDRIYVYTDEDGKERIAYKLEGATRKPVTDEKGNAVTRPYNDTEMEVLTDEANDIFDLTKKGDTIGFDALVTKYSEDTGIQDFPNGYYVTEDTNYESPEVIKALFEMAVGDVKMVKSDYGIHIVMRYETEPAAYTDSEYEDLFISPSTGTYVFINDLISELLAEYLEPYKSKIVVDEKVLATADIKRAGINYYY